jgi:transcriptional regulator with XRE-family HTH domain
MRTKKSNRVATVHIGKRFRQFRKKSGLNQLEVGKLLGLHQGAISRIENGRQNLTPDQLLKAARIFRGGISLFFKGIDS